jgi:hypothetical protein
MPRKTTAARIACTAAFLVALVLVPAALAGKGGGGGKPTGGGGGTTGGGGYTVGLSTPGPYTFGETVYTTTNAPQVAMSYVGMSCSENGVLLLSGTHANWSGGWYFNYAWQLGPSQVWGGGPANCTVTVFHISNNKQITDASSTFQVSG